MGGNEREEDAILRILIYIKDEMIKNDLDKEVVLMDELIVSTEKTLNDRKKCRNNH